jgi:hypothetical protein
MERGTLNLTRIWFSQKTLINMKRSDYKDGPWILYFTRKEGRTG